jgi:Domain of unknown function (DUF4375)
MPNIEAWDAYGALSELEQSTLNGSQRALLAVCDLRQEVNSGGFDAYFRYWGGNTAPDAVKALPTLLGQDWADLLAEAMDLLGPDYPTDVNTREDRLNDRDLDNQLESLDARYYDLELSTNADARLNAYLARNPEAMA